MKHRQKEYKAPVYIGQNLYIKPSYVVSIPEYYKESSGMSMDFLKNMENLKDNEHKGKLSRKAITGLRNSINWLCLAAKKKRVFSREKNFNFWFKINFVTLTLPDTPEAIGSADLQNKLLNPWLTYMRKYHGLKNYVWRLEFQANGKLHVHISTDSFLHLAVVRDQWNRLLDKNGYLDQFYKANGHKDPNSTDIHATKKVKNMAAYLAKYMSKKGSEYKLSKKKTPVKPLHVLNSKAWYIQRVNFWNSPFNPRPIKGKIWSCSRELSRANKLAVHIAADEIKENLSCFMRSDIEYKDISIEPKTIAAQFDPTAWQNQPRKIGEIYYLKALDWFTKIRGKARKAFTDTIEAIQNAKSLEYKLPKRKTFIPALLLDFKAWIKQKTNFLNSTFNPKFEQAYELI